MTDIGEAVVVRNADGTRGVERADPLIAVSPELLANPELDPDFVEPDGTLRLDTAGEYRYRFVRLGVIGERIYQRIVTTPPVSRHMVHQPTYPTFGDGTVRPQAGG